MSLEFANVQQKLNKLRVLEERRHFTFDARAVMRSTVVRSILN